MNQIVGEVTLEQVYTEIISTCKPTFLKSKLQNYYDFEDVVHDWYLKSLEKGIKTIQIHTSLRAYCLTMFRHICTKEDEKLRRSKTVILYENTSAKNFGVSKETMEEMHDNGLNIPTEFKEKKTNFVEIEDIKKLTKYSYMSQTEIQNTKFFATKEVCVGNKKYPPNVGSLLVLLTSYLWPEICEMYGTTRYRIKNSIPELS